jgi:Flp pilus assembly pilin Flp
MNLVQKKGRSAMKGLKRLNQDQRGIESLEYLLIAALVIIASAGAWRYLGQEVGDSTRQMADAVKDGVEQAMEKSGLGSGGVKGAGF